MGFVLLLGGARSGKSDLARRMAVDSGGHVTFIATATPGDEEMADRIARHRAERPEGWSTVEEPIELLRAVCSAPAEDFLVVDCLTLWVSNLLGAGRGGGDVRPLGEAVARELKGRRGVVVSNEVGLGIVPANALAREFRDTLGAMNSVFAARAERAVLLVAGRTLELT
jgi:adenosyl cobinamide kinase/adenosyl cobinamide phosphate guanylyltransferase